MNSSKLLRVTSIVLIIKSVLNLYQILKTVGDFSSIGIIEYSSGGRTLTNMEVSQILTTRITIFMIITIIYILDLQYKCNT